MLSSSTSISGPVSSTMPIMGKERLCPAFGYRGSSTTTKVMKFAEYIPIIGMVVGSIHLVWSLRKWREGTPEINGHIIRSLIALTNFGIVIAIKDLMEEFSRRSTETGEEKSPPTEIQIGLEGVHSSMVRKNDTETEKLKNPPAKIQTFKDLLETSKTLKRGLESFQRATEQKIAPAIKLLRPRIQNHAEMILQFNPKGITYPRILEAVQTIQQEARNAQALVSNESV
jgi:hypothetical protein